MSKKNVAIHEVVESLKTITAAHGFAQKASNGNLGLVASTESHTDDVRAGFKAIRGEFENDILAAFTGFGMESLGFDVTPRSGRPQWEQDLEDNRRSSALTAAGIVAAAIGDPAAFARAGLTSALESREGSPVVMPTSVSGPQGSLDYRDRPHTGLEAYDNKNLTDFLPYSIAFNIYGQRQDEFSELLFKTFVVPPEQAGIEVAASRLLVYRDQAHTNPAHFDMGKKNLIRAHVDYTILKDESTKLIPVAAVDNSHDSQLVAPALVGTTSLLIAGVSVPTRPYKIGVPLNIIALSQYQPLVGAGAQFDNQDAVDSAIRLDSVVIDTGVANAPGVVFPTLRLPGSTFQRALTGNYRDMNLNFETEALVINAQTKAVDGTAVAGFAGIVSGNLTVYVAFGLNAKVNTEKGNTQTSATSLTVVHVLDANGNELSLTSGAGAAVVTALAAFKVAGFTLDVNRTNSNRRTRGLRVDTTLVRERYYIPLGSPISVARPNDPWQQTQAVDLKALVTTARIRNSNNAVTAMFNIIDALKASASGPAFNAGEDDSAAIGGLGRLLIKPFYYEVDFDLVDAINSTSSANKAEDVAGALVNKVRDVSFTMLRDSNYQPALEAQLGGPAAKPTLFVGTDQRLIRHLMVTGDDRTFTPMFDTAIVKESLDARMYDKIVLTFVRPEATEPDLLSFGAHIWSTELVSTLQVTRSGESNSIETMVQPRTLHINMMPVIAIINVQGLSEVLSDAAQYHITPTVAVSP